MNLAPVRNDLKDPFITIVHDKDRYCKLLLLYEHSFYYSEKKKYKELLYFKNPSLIEINLDNITIHSKNNKHLLIINF
jgi:hypothetical protein